MSVNNSYFQLLRYKGPNVTMFPNSLYRRVFCYLSLFGVWVEYLMYIKLVNKCNFQNLTLSVFSNRTAGGFNFFNKTASTFIEEGMLVSVTAVFFHGSYSQQTSSMNLLHVKHCKLYSSSCPSTDCLQKTYIPMKCLRWVKFSCKFSAVCSIFTTINHAPYGLPHLSLQ